MMAKKVTKKEIVKDLNVLASLVDVCSSFQTELGELIQQAFRSCPDLYERYKEINASLDTMTKRRCDLVEKIVIDVTKRGQTIKGDLLMAVYSNGKITWETSELNGYAVKHPEINKFKKIGKASVAIREVKKEEE